MTPRREDRKPWDGSLAQNFTGNKEVEGLMLVSGLAPNRKKRENLVI